MRVLARVAIPVLLLSLEMTLWFFSPAILGYEGAGILVEVAEGVTNPWRNTFADVYRYALGQGAGFYLNAMEFGWETHYRM